MGLDRRLADEKRPGDLPVGPARRDEAQHLGLARRQLSFLLLVRHRGWPAGSGGQQALLDFGAEHGLAGGGGQHGPADLGPADLGPGGVLGQVAERAGLQGVVSAS